ncbi:hypothetical protein Lser_V15G33764 [Lactuca serriola]
MIQKDIVNCFSKEIIKSICDEICKDVFRILVDESSDVSKKEQMAIVLRYVDRLRIVKERFIGVVHVLDTSSLTLKAAIDTVYSNSNLTIDQVRGQGYDRASNMSGALTVWRLLSFVAVAKKHDDVEEFFEQLVLAVTIRSKKERVATEIGIGETETRRRLNQEISLVRAGDTRWGSHFRTIVSLLNLFAEVVAVLKYIKEEGSTLSNRNQAKGILSYFKTLDFILLLHLMLEILCLTDTLSKHLQKKDQDILEATSLVKGIKKALLVFRKDGFPQILKKVCAFCEKHSIGIVDMSEYYVTSQKHRTN